MRGRKNTPAAKAELTELPAPPAHFDQLAQDYYRSFGQVLIKRRLLADDDLHALGMLATSYALYHRACERITAEDAVCLSARGDGQVKSPWVTIQNQAWARIRPLLSEFGLTPCARAKFKATDDDGEDEFFDQPAPNQS